MSLNWKEIDLILSELDVTGAKIERVIQPSFDSLSLGLYRAGKTTELFFSIAQGACRVHALSSPPPKPTRPLRFMECLRSRARGGRIESVGQIGRERIVKLGISVPRSAPSDDGGNETVEFSRLTLYARLWSGAGNVVLVDEQGIVVDALARRPRRGEISGERCAIEEGLVGDPASTKGRPEREFEIRELPGTGSFNERIEGILFGKRRRAFPRETPRDRPRAIRQEDAGARRADRGAVGQGRRIPGARAPARARRHTDGQPRPELRRQIPGVRGFLPGRHRANTRGPAPVGRRERPLAVRAPRKGQIGARGPRSGDRERQGLATEARSRARRNRKRTANLC